MFPSENVWMLYIKFKESNDSTMQSVLFLAMSFGWLSPVMGSRTEAQ